MTRTGTSPATRSRRLRTLLLTAGLVRSVAIRTGFAAPAGALSPDVPPPTIPPIPIPGPGQDEPNPSNLEDDGIITIDVGGTGENSASQSIILILGLAVLSLAPSIVLMLSSFTRIIIVFSLTRNALGLQGVPPNQVLVGLALFLSLFIMAPTIDELNEVALQPYLAGDLTQEEAVEAGTAPIREFMLAHTDPAELEVMLDAAGQETPIVTDEIGMTVLIPAFMLTELKTAFIIGFVIFIPFLIIDIVVAAALMALGMMMLPPAFISLPFKLLLFIMVGGWSLVVETLLATYL
ncbi:MAG: flagellar type III secretion system pore protein FliP [Actinomycetota bacterium]